MCSLMVSLLNAGLVPEAVLVQCKTTYGAPDMQQKTPRNSSAISEELPKRCFDASPIKPSIDWRQHAGLVFDALYQPDEFVCVNTQYSLKAKGWHHKGDHSRTRDNPPGARMENLRGQVWHTRGRSRCLVSSRSNRNCPTFALWRQHQLPAGGRSWFNRARISQSGRTSTFLQPLLPRSQIKRFSPQFPTDP